MALRTNTIEYAFPLSIASVASGTARDFTQIAALAIPETSSRTFRSVTLEVSYVDATTATGVNTTAILLGIALGAVARNDATVTQTIVHSGENYSILVSRDVTSYFVANYTGTSMTADCRLTVTGPISINATAKLIITYEFDDTSETTRIKTVKIPIDGNTGNLTTGFTNIGGVANQLPALDTFLPEASKVYRDVFFQMEYHTGTTAAAAAVLNLRYNGAATIADGSWGHNLITDTFVRRIDKILGGFNTASANSIEASTTSVTARPCPCLSGYIVVTYEYDHSTSSSLMVSIQVATMDEAGWSGGNTTADKSRFTRDIFVQEPTTITLVQSGLLCFYNEGAGITLDLRIGSQASRTFTHAATVRGGVITSMRRLDSGAVGGAGMTLARGLNTLTVDWFTTTSGSGNIASNMSAIVFINYTCGKPGGGSGVINHTTHWMIYPYATGGLVQRLQVNDATTAIIPETDYWLVGVSYQLIILTSGTGISIIALAFQCEIQSGEAEQAGWQNLYSALFSSDPEMGTSISYCRARTDFMRWPLDTDTSRLNIETDRDYRYDSNVNTGVIWQSALLLTYHNFTYTIAGTISGSLGGTVDIDAYRDDTGERIGSTSRTGNGAYSITWYDNTIPVWVVAYETTTRKGVSVLQVAGNTFNIDLSPPGGGGATVGKLIGDGGGLIN